MARWHVAAGVALGMLCTGSAEAAQISITGVTEVGTTPFTGDVATLTDNFIPAYEAYYRDDTVSTGYGSAPLSFSLSFAPNVVTDFLVSVDNNDDYGLDFYLGGAPIRSFVITAGQGTSPFGMDTFATFAAVPNQGTQVTGFAPTLADMVVVTGFNGDQAYAIGEVQLFGGAAVPEPASWAMLIGGMGLIGGAVRRRRAPAMRLA